MFFKVAFKKEIHVLSTETNVNFKKLSEFINSAFKRLPQKYHITYKDADGDTICLFNDLDLKILLESGFNRVRLEIQETSEDFYDETQEIQIHEDIQEKKEEPVEPIQEKEEEMNVSSVLSNTQNLDDSISEKLSKILPDLVSKIKDEILSESKIFEKNQTIPKIEVAEKIPQKVEQKPKAVHSRVICDECQCNPIIGVRYKCAVCPDFDLCEKCEATTTHDHPFLKIKHLGQTPLKIFTILDSEEESLEMNGHHIPLNGIGQCLNAFGTFFRPGCQRRENFKNCRKMFKKGMRGFMEQMRANNEKFEKKEETKTEESSEKIEECSLDQPIIIEEDNKPVVEIKEQKKEEIKVEESRKPEPEIREVNQRYEDHLIECANYISEILGDDFNSCYHFAQVNSDLTKEELLMKYIQQQ